MVFFFQAEDGIRDGTVTGVQTCALPIFLGLRCPVCARTYTGGKGYCPVDAVELTPEHEIDLPQIGTVTNYTIITPVKYPGQTETDPFARVHVWLDGTDAVLGYQELLDTPNGDVRIGMRVAA